MVGGTYGIGGGAIIAPLLVTWFGLSVHSVAGAALAGTGVTSLAAVIAYQAIALLDPSTRVAPNWTLGLLFGLGGIAGTYLGALCQGRVPARLIEWMLGLDPRGGGGPLHRRFLRPVLGNWQPVVPGR